MNVGEIIYDTLIAGDSYKTLLKGLSVTLQISLLSVLLGTLLGMVICALRRSRFWIVRNLAAGYIAIVRGSPVVLLLMLMYYVVFAGSNVSATMVAVAAFSLHMSAYTAACFYSAIHATDVMQVEAAENPGLFQMAGVYPDYIATDGKDSKRDLSVHHCHPDTMDQCSRLCHYYGFNEGHQ